MIQIEKTVVSMDLDELCIVLGGKCNLKCSHCHCEEREFGYNPDLIRFIKSCNITKLKFIGGETLLYFDTIKKILSQLDTDEYRIRLVTNGTILTQEMVDYFNDHHILVLFSYDGEGSTRDESLMPRWELARQLLHFAISVYTSGSKNWFKIVKDIKQLKIDYALNRLWTHDGNVFPHFLHTTEKTGRLNSNEDAKEYLRSMAQAIELQLIEYVQTGNLAGKDLLRRSITAWYLPKPIKTGVACCNEMHLSVTTEGNFLGCPYSTQVMGNIYTGFIENYTDILTPVKCTRCEVQDICKTFCNQSKTGYECYIMKTMNRHLKVLSKKYGIDFAEMLKPYEEPKG